MFSGEGLKPKERAGSRGGSTAVWPWTTGIRLLLGFLVIVSGVALRIASHSVSAGASTICRGVPVLVIDPNTAPASVLEALPHVGPVLVKRLIEQRESRPFASAEDLRRRVRGLGPATLARLTPHLRIEPGNGRVFSGHDATIDAVTGQPRLAQGPSRPARSW
jgi:competence protein ComEA